MSEPGLRVAAPPSAFEADLARLTAAGPEWLRVQRRAAWSRALALGLPSREAEVWRWSEVSLLDAEAYGPAGAAPSLPAPAGLPERLDGRFESAGAGPGRGWLSEEALRAGVILCDLRLAASQHEALVREHLGALVTAEDALLGRNLALHDGGALLYVPAGVELSAPVVLQTELADRGARHLRHLIIVERGARLVVGELSLSTPTSSGLLHEVAELALGDGARLGWLQWQELGRGARHASFRRARLGRDSHLESLAVNLGAEYSRVWLEAALAGEGARSDLLGIAYPMGRQRLEQWTVQDHLAPHATSDLLYRTALDDQARSLYYGTIRVRPGATRTDAYQANRNLLLSSGARADTNPQLEIANNDVRCTHGATVGPLDEEQLFYLMTRGLPRDQAERLLVLGFFGDVLARGAWSQAGPALEHALRARVMGGAA